MSVAVAVSAAAIQVFRFGSEWGVDDQYANALEAEGWAYFQKAGHYRDADYPNGAFQIFFSRIEALRRLRAERRTADIRSIAAEAAKEPATETRSGERSAVGMKAIEQKTEPVDAPPFPDFGRQ